MPSYVYLCIIGSQTSQKSQVEAVFSTKEKAYNHGIAKLLQKRRKRDKLYCTIKEYRVDP